MLSRIADENEGRRRQDDPNPPYHPRAIYRDCLRDLVGIHTPQDVDALLAAAANGEEQDNLVMFELFDPTMIYRRNALVVKPEHVPLVTRRGFHDDGGVGIGTASEDWMDEDHAGQRAQQEGAEASVWELRGALLDMIRGEGD